MVVNDGEILEAAGMLSNPTTHISLGIWKPRNCSAYINWIAVQSFPQMNTSGSDIIACKLLWSENSENPPAFDEEGNSSD